MKKLTVSETVAKYNLKEYSRVKKSEDDFIYGENFLYHGKEVNDKKGQIITYCIDRLELVDDPKDKNDYSYWLHIDRENINSNKITHSFRELLI